MNANDLWNQQVAAEEARAICNVKHPKFGHCVVTGTHGDADRPHRYEAQDEHQGWCPISAGGDCECICENCSEPVQMSEYGVAYSCPCRA